MKKILAIIVSSALSLSVVGSPVLATSPASIFGEALRGIQDRLATKKMYMNDFKNSTTL